MLGSWLVAMDYVKLRMFDSCRVQFISIAVAVLISACGGSGSDAPAPLPPSINVSSSSIDVAAAGESISVEVSNGGGGTLNWSASLPDSVDWARISGGSSGTNSGTIQIEIDANSTDAREFELTVSASGVVSRTVTVQQADGRAAIEVTTESTELDGEGGSVSLQVQNTGIATMQWSASLPEGLDWAYIRSGEEGTDAGEIILHYGLNGGIDREFEVTVTASAATNTPQSLTLSQEWFATSACTFPEARAEVIELMRKWYYFNDELVQRLRYDGLDIEDYDNLDSLLDDLRWQPQDWIFTNWGIAAEADRLSFEGQSFGFGFHGHVIVTFPDFVPLYYEVVDVYVGTPAGNANLERGDRIVSLNGKQVTEMAEAPHVIDEFGPYEEGVEVHFEVEKQSGELRTFSLTKELIDFPAVPEEHVQILDTDAGKVGYLHIRGFWGDANMRLLEEFAEFNTTGIRNLIVDLRYSSGGNAPIGYGLATLIGGPELYENQVQTVLSRRIHNEQLRLEGWDTTAYFGCGAYPTPDMVERCENQSSMRHLENVVFITNILTFGIGELVITALQPFENVALVGTRTLGMPLGRYGLHFCLADQNDTSTNQAYLWPLSFAKVNAEGFGDYYNGLQVTQGCQVFEDDLSRPLGDREEPRLAAALRYLETGSCGAPASSRVATQGKLLQLVLDRDPSTQLLGH